MMMDNQFLSEGKNLISIIRDLFSEDSLGESRIKFDTNNFEHRFIWKLNTNPHKPKKMSMPLIIVMTQEFLEDYHFLSLQDKENKFREEIQRKLKKFNPDYDISPGEAIPIECWYF